MSVERLIEELMRLPATAPVFVIDSGKRNAVPLDIVEINYAAGQVTIGVDVELYKK